MIFRRAGEGVQGYWYLADLVHFWQRWSESWVSASTKGVARWLFALFQPRRLLPGWKQLMDEGIPWV